jgi:uncharacterized membrane protein (UPF0127 family)
MLPVLKYNGVEIAKNIEFAKNILSQMIGLMFRKNIPFDYAMIFVLKKPSSVDVHMFFVFFPISVIFLDEKKKISGLAVLNPWIGYKAMKNIKYVIEMNEDAIKKNKLAIGERMDF